MGLVALARAYEASVNAWAMKARSCAEDRNVAAGKVYECRKAMCAEIDRIEGHDWIAAFMDYMK